MLNIFKYPPVLCFLVPLSCLTQSWASFCSVFVSVIRLAQQRRLVVTHSRDTRMKIFIEYQNGEKR